MKKTTIVTSCALIIVLSVSIISLVFYLHKPVIIKAGVHYFLKPGTTIQKFVRDLDAEGAVTHTATLKALLLSHPHAKLQVGEYFFKPNSNAQTIANQVLTGEVVFHTFTIVDGSNFYAVMHTLNQLPYINHTLTGLTPAAIAQKMQIPYATPEGLLLPETYFYTWNNTDLALLNRAYQSMQTVLLPAWQDREKSLTYTTPYDALIVASMLEKETAIPSEMPLIAAVILKRLALKMRLQIDSTVIYGLEPNFSGKLSRTNLQQKTVYNTYKNLGLPPTPIAMPGIQAIVAALHPDVTSALYFVAKGDGTHVFSATLNEHNLAVNEYRKQQKR